jgi:hypothetical protein
MTTKEYDPTEVDVLFGLAQLSGFAENTMVKVAFENKRFELVQGVDGQTSRSKNKKRSALVTVSLMQTSASNSYLSAAMALDDLAPAGAGVVPFLIRDKNGTSLFASDEAWIEKEPDIEYAEKPGPREWQIRVVGYTNFVGGS